MAGKKTLSAKEVVADVRAGATDEFLMKKYGFSEKGLQSLFQKLIAAKVLTQADLDGRRSSVEDICERISEGDGATPITQFSTPSTNGEYDYTAVVNSVVALHQEADKLRTDYSGDGSGKTVNGQDQITADSVRKERRIFIGGIIGTLLVGLSVGMVLIWLLPGNEQAISGNLYLAGKLAWIYFVFRLSRFLQQPVWLTIIYCVLTPFSVLYLIPLVGLLVSLRKARLKREFDVSQYFDVLKHVSPPVGHVLDYVYFSGETAGRPRLYLRKETQPRLKTCEEYKAAGASEQECDLPILLGADGTPESFFELVVFKILAGQFQLFWHAGYNDTKIVTSPNEVKEIIAGLSLSDELEAKAWQMELTPIVEFLDQHTASVSLVVFSNWGGFSRVTEAISRHYPHTFGERNIQRLVPYECGIRF